MDDEWSGVPEGSPERIHPLNTVEQIAQREDWAYERASENEITILVDGNLTSYQISYTWMDSLEALHVACAFDFKVPETRLSDVRTLTSLINEQLWIGHFDIWSTEGLVMFRYSLVLSGSEASEAQVKDILDTALRTCETHFPAFQFVLWAGKTPREALDAALFETKGSA